MVQASFELYQVACDDVTVKLTTPSTLPLSCRYSLRAGMRPLLKHDYEHRPRVGMTQSSEMLTRHVMRLLRGRPASAKPYKDITT